MPGLPATSAQCGNLADHPNIFRDGFYGSDNLWRYRKTTLYMKESTNNCSPFQPINTGPHSFTAIAVGTNYCYLLDEMGDSWFYKNMDRRIYKIILPQNADKIIAIASGTNHNIILNKNSRVFVFGNNSSGQLGLGHYNHAKAFTQVTLPQGIGGIKAIAAGGDQSMLLSENNQLFVCGANQCAQLGLGHNRHVNTFTQVTLPQEIGMIKAIAAGDDRSIIVNEDNQLFDYCNNRNLFIHKRMAYTPVELPQKIGTIKTIAANSPQTMIVNDKGEVFADSTSSDFWGRRTRTFKQVILQLSLLEADRITAIAANKTLTMLLVENVLATPSQSPSNRNRNMAPQYPNPSAWVV